MVMITLSLFSKRRLDMVIDTISLFSRRGLGMVMATISFFSRIDQVPEMKNSFFPERAWYGHDHSLISSNRSSPLLENGIGLP